MEEYVIGVDFGTSSVRAIVVNGHTGEEIASSEFLYPRWKEEKYINASKNQFRQHPKDYIEGLEFTIREVVNKVEQHIVGQIKAISVDTTGSTPVAVDSAGVPLALHPEFSDNPNAMFILWKDHTSTLEAEQINEQAKKFDIDYLKYVGGIYSSEWFWAKLLHILRVDEGVRAACYSWVEHCDWIPFLLTGGTHADDIKRSVCAAGHKALWAEDFGGLPPEEFFISVDPLLKGFRNRLNDRTYASDTSAGIISSEWAEKLGLPSNVKVGIGALDAHMGAVGGQIEPYYLSKVMGTSTCDMMVVQPKDLNNMLVKGICGQVESSIVPGMIGLEAGQSAFGDVYAWFKDLITWPIKKYLSSGPLLSSGNSLVPLLKELESRVLYDLGEEASKLPIDSDLELAVDWFNGRRTPDADPLLKGAIHSLNLGSDAPRIFRSLVEATCFGAKKIVDRFIEEGIEVRGIIAIGGVAKKSPFVLQMMSDILGIPIKVHKSEQTCALGASMFAATVAGIYPDVQQAMDSMGGGFDQEYQPNRRNHEIYQERYEHYSRLCHQIEDSKIQRSIPTELVHS